MKDYLSIEYDERVRPLTDYPEKLCSYLFQRFGMKAGMSFLEAGCGRGEFLSQFKMLGLDSYGVDNCPVANDFNANITVSIVDIEEEGLPFDEETFDIVYSKSLLEHFPKPDIYFREARRVLKPGGLLLTMVPDWEANYKIYFDDYTHRSPFSVVSLETIYQRFEFNEIEVQKFRQLPIVWKYPVLNYFCALLSPVIPVRTKNKFLRWSRELMLLGAGRK
jgi:SAM-dependent methyltransferase